MPVLCLRLSLLAATVLGIHGCMSSPADQLAAVNAQPAKKLSTSQTTGLQSNTTANVADQSAIANQAAADAALLNSTANAVGDVPPSVVNADQPVTDSNALVGHKNINAAQNSIFASPDTATVPAQQGDQQQVALNGIETGAEPDQTLNAAQNSIYAGAVESQPRETASIPLPDADNVAAVQDLALAGMAIPDELNATPVTPTEADPGLASAAAEFDQQIAAGNPDQAQQQDASVAAVEQQAKPVKKKRTLADFFRGDFADDEDEDFDNKRFAQQKQRTVNTNQIPNMQTAALADNQLPGVNTNALFATEQHFSDDELSEGGDQPGLMQLASLSGMTRVAPNGLWTQTDKVEVRCLRPQLVSMLKSVEDHYKRPVIVTSGFRDVGHNRRVGGVRHSLHTLCAAADIQVQGVSKWALADYLRSIPGRGGVGTYCHTDSVHVDIGGERDWNWRCRRKKSRRS